MLLVRLNSMADSSQIVKCMEHVALISPEGKKLEYKSTVNSKTLSREVVAFANTEGGKIMIGVDDDGSIVGVKGLMVDSVTNMVRDGCVPPLSPEVVEEDCDGKKVITVTVRPDGDVPYMTTDGAYHVRVGATVRIASMPELIKLIAKGPHKGTMQFVLRLPQLYTKIRSSMTANAGFDQALMGISELSDLGWKVGESEKIEIVEAVNELLQTPCNNDEVISRLLILLVVLIVPFAPITHESPPSKTLFERAVEIMKAVLFQATIVPEVNDRTKHVLLALCLVGLGCLWAKYNDQFEAVMEAVKSNYGKDRKLDKLCRDMESKLAKCASEEPTHTTRRLGMTVEFFEDQHDSRVGFRLLHNIFTRHA